MSIIGELGRHRRRKVVELRVPVNPAELADRVGRGVYNIGVDVRRDDIRIDVPGGRPQPARPAADASSPPRGRGGILGRFGRGGDPTT